VNKCELRHCAYCMYRDVSRRPACRSCASKLRLTGTERPDPRGCESVLAGTPRSNASRSGAICSTCSPCKSPRGHQVDQPMAHRTRIVLAQQQVRDDHCDDEQPESMSAGSLLVRESSRGGGPACPADDGPSSRARPSGRPGELVGNVHRPGRWPYADPATACAISALARADRAGRVPRQPTARACPTER
jgi:hypothetical protein